MTEFFDAYHQGYDPIKICKEYVEDVLKVLFPYLDADQLAAFGGEIAYPSCDCTFNFPLKLLLGPDSFYKVPDKKLIYFTDQENLADILNNNAVKLLNSFGPPDPEREPLIDMEIQSYLANMYALDCYGMDGQDNGQLIWPVFELRRKDAIALELDIELSQGQHDEYLFGAMDYRDNFPTIHEEYTVKKEQFETAHGITIRDGGIQALLIQYQNSYPSGNENEVRLIYLPREQVSPWDNPTLFYSMHSNMPDIYHRLPLSNIRSKEFLPSVRIRNIHVSPSTADFEMARDTIEMLLYANRASFNVAGINILPADTTEMKMAAT